MTEKKNPLQITQPESVRPEAIVYQFSEAEIQRLVEGGWLNRDGLVFMRSRSGLCEATREQLEEADNRTKAPQEQILQKPEDRKISPGFWLTGGK